jgi:hypothetical protein
MFKPYKKLNENNVKKDFFKVKKTIENNFINIKSEITETSFFQTNDLSKITFPEKNKIFFINTTSSRSIVEFVKELNPKETLLFCSRLNKKSFDMIKNKNLIGIGLSERVLQNNPEFLNEVKKQTQVKIKNNHCKMLLFNIDENFFIVSGSGNASINSRIENYIIENNKKKYNSIIKYFINA